MNHSGFDDIYDLQSIKKPKLFWVSAGAPLASAILSTLLVFAFKAQDHGISVVSLMCFNTSFQVHSTLIFLMFCFLKSDWETTRRTESSIMEHVAFPWKLLRPGNKNWARDGHNFTHCKQFFPWIFSFSMIEFYIQTVCSIVHKKSQLL